MKKQNALLWIVGGVIAAELARRQAANVGAIVDAAPPGLTPCADGKFSTYPTSAAGGVCSYHGGRAVKGERKAKPNLKEKFLLEVVERIDEKRVKEWRKRVLKTIELLQETPKSQRKKRSQLADLIDNLQNGIEEFEKLKINSSARKVNDFWRKYGHLSYGYDYELNKGVFDFAYSYLLRFNERNGTNLSRQEIGLSGLGAIFQEIPGEFYEYKQQTALFGLPRFGRVSI